MLTKTNEVGVKKPLLRLQCYSSSCYEWTGNSEAVVTCDFQVVVPNRLQAGGLPPTLNDHQ